MQSIPGVESAAVGLSVPYEQALNYAVKIADGQQSGDQDMTNLVYVTPAYFEALQIPLAPAASRRHAMLPPANMLPSSMRLSPKDTSAGRIASGVTC